MNYYKWLSATSKPGTFRLLVFGCSDVTLPRFGVVPDGGTVHFVA